MMTAPTCFALVMLAFQPEVKALEAELPTSRLLRLVGEQLSFEHTSSCIRYPDRHERAEDSAADAQCHVDDLQNLARYSVRKDLDGEAGETVTFLASDWTSYYANSRHALLYVLESPDGTFLLAGLAVSVYPTSDGDWASCDADEGAETVAFAGNPVFGRTDGMSPYGIAERYPVDDFVVVGNEAYCIRGRRLETLINDLDREVEQMRERRFPHLPGPETKTPDSLL